MATVYIHILFAVLLFISCSDNKIVVNPDDCGKHLFEVLKNFDTVNKHKFPENFVPLQIIHELGNDKDQIRNKKRRNRFKNMTQNEYEDQITSFAYNLIHEEGEAFGIIWEDIKYEGFIHRAQYYDSMTSIKGKLVFEYKNRLYDVGCVYIKVDNKWMLAAIAGLYMHGVNNPQKPAKNRGLMEL